MGKILQLPRRGVIEKDGIWRPIVEKLNWKLGIKKFKAQVEEERRLEEYAARHNPRDGCEL